MRWRTCSRAWLWSVVASVAVGGVGLHRGELGGLPEGLVVVHGVPLGDQPPSEGGADLGIVLHEQDAAHAYKPGTPFVLVS